ncbi:MAG: ABC transporter permease subunit [Planctomycetota bacterium]|nr:ABC transporter permease subunit [Planctomycetota bacterium]
MLLVLLGAAVWAFLYLDMSFAQLVPNEGGLEIAQGFFSSAVAPSSEVLGTAVRSLEATVIYAAAAMSVSLLLGLLLGFLASTAWWSGDPVGGRTLFGRTVAPVLYGVTRFVIGFMRSVHEVLWAMLFLAAFGITPISAVIAIAIPYGGTLAKIFSEMIDESDRGPARALRAAGASGLQVYFFGLVPRALPDMLAYAFYRFECALRSSAVLGFFGVATIGRDIELAFLTNRYGEVWTYIYVLMAVIVVFDVWSGHLRKRFVA